MRAFVSRRVSALCLIYISFAAACGPGTAEEEVVPSGPPEADLAETSSPLTAEQPGEIASLVSRFYDRSHSAVTVKSYANPQIPGCSASMVGPNILMTAAHCGVADMTALFRTYRERGAQSDTEGFTCRWLLSTWCDTDLLLYYCDPNSAGENPGDKYGYYDFSQVRPSVGLDVYSVWSNPINSLGLADARIYSRGTVTSNTRQFWSTPDAVAMGIGIEASVWAQPGASGSPTVNYATQKIVMGPTSLAPSAGGRQRWATSMYDYLWYGKVYEPNQSMCGSKPGGINATVARTLGLTPSKYGSSGGSYVDNDVDWLFDIQTDLERMRGEARKRWYRLGFESERQNALWQLGAGASFDAAGGYARITSSTIGQKLAHHKLNLAVNVDYVLTVRTWTASAGSPNALNLQVTRPGLDGAPDVVLAEKAILTTAGSGWATNTVTFRSTLGSPSVRLKTASSIDVYVDDITIREASAVMNFDTNEQRLGWTSELFYQQGLITPDGRTTGQPNWAGLVAMQSAGDTSFPLQTGTLGFSSPNWHQVCFDVKKTSKSTGSLGRLVINHSGFIAVNYTFPLTATWTTLCTPTTAPPGAAQVSFGFGSSTFTEYLVDNIRVL